MNSSIENTCSGPKKSWNRALFQGLPIFMWMLLLILVPLVIMFLTSFFVKEGI